MMTRCFLGRVCVVLGICMAVLSMGVLVHEANAGCASCSGGTIVCSSLTPQSQYGCGPGYCPYSYWGCSVDCLCQETQTQTCQCLLYN